MIKPPVLRVVPVTDNCKRARWGIEAFKTTGWLWWKKANWVAYGVCYTRRFVNPCEFPEGSKGNSIVRLLFDTEQEALQKINYWYNTFYTTN